ncbi:MAG: CCA tRNA nucleotidyltransferase [Fuerstiella sp.]
MPAANNAAPREFALQVVRELRNAGFEALWAGGCVRDDLLGITPDDYDVATSATPEQVTHLFGRKKTVPVGASFGVIMVLGPSRECGQVEVATFRSDGQYVDGRRPTAVTFSSPEEDAQRRDFTINGMFFDPIATEVIDYVGGRADLSAGIVRAIGDASARFTEDKLRMLRAVRFAATYEFLLADSTADAIRSLSAQIMQVSIERIAQELRRMLAHRTRAVSVRMLAEVGLLPVLFPTIFGPDASHPASIKQRGRILSRLSAIRFEPALAILLNSCCDFEKPDPKQQTAGLRAECRRLRLSNDETNCICWVARATHLCRQAEILPLHILKPILGDTRHTLMLDVLHAHAPDDEQILNATEYLARYLQKTPVSVIDPPPLVDGSDLIQLGVRPGPGFSEILTAIRHAQLDETCDNRPEALRLATQLAAIRRDQPDADESRG